MLAVSPNTLDTDLSCVIDRFPYFALVREIQHFELQCKADQDGVGIFEIVVLGGVPWYYKV